MDFIYLLIYYYNEFNLIFKNFFLVILFCEWLFIDFRVNLEIKSWFGFVCI